MTRRHPFLPDYKRHARVDQELSRFRRQTHHVAKALNVKPRDAAQALITIDFHPLIHCDGTEAANVDAN